MPAVAHNEHAERAEGDVVQNYVKAIYALQAGRGGVVSTNALSDRLGVTPASVSAMLKKLSRLGLVRHTPYHGVRLTRDGERAALDVVRRHRLLELFLAETLDLPWDRVHGEAEVLEHHISEELAELIDEKLGHPTHDPHGDPIPGADLAIEEMETVTLQSLEPGSEGVFARISDSDPAMLRYLSDRGIAPGDHLKVMDKQPFDGPLTVSFEGSEETLGGALARAIRVEVRR
jgi:DtxR family Mn-dependent transcriptional regulator